MSDLVVQLPALEFRDVEHRALAFFSRDISSVDGELSYDDRAMSDPPDAFDDADVRVLLRGMRLDRGVKPDGPLPPPFPWLVHQAPVHLIEAIPRDVDLGEVTDDAWPAVRGQIAAALDGFVATGQKGGRRLSVATKMLHLKRPRLIPICDSITVGLLGTARSGYGTTKVGDIAVGLNSCDVLRFLLHEHSPALEEVRRFLAEHGYERTPLRVIDSLLRDAYGGRLRRGEPRPQPEGAGPAR